MTLNAVSIRMLEPKIDKDVVIILSILLPVVSVLYFIVTKAFNNDNPLTVEWVLKKVSI